MPNSYDLHATFREVFKPFSHGAINAIAEQDWGEHESGNPRRSDMTDPERGYISCCPLGIAILADFPDARSHFSLPDSSDVELVLGQHAKEDDFSQSSTDTFISCWDNGIIGTEELVNWARHQGQEGPVEPAPQRMVEIVTTYTETITREVRLVVPYAELADDLVEYEQLGYPSGPTSLQYAAHDYLDEHVVDWMDGHGEVIDTNNNDMPTVREVNVRILTD